MNRRMYMYGMVLASFILGACSSTKKAVELVEPVDLVNPLQGTASVFEFSTGNTYPAVCLPWGMNFWTPQTRANGNGWQYVYFDNTIQGFKQTHQPSPWINDYGCFSLMPQLNEPIYNQKKRAVGFSHENEESRPYYYGVTLDNGIKTEITPSHSGAIFQFTYPKDNQPYLLLDCFHHQGDVTVDTATGIVTGKSSFYAPNNNTVLPDNFATHFRLTFDTPIVEYGVFIDGKKHKGVTTASGKNAALYLSFGDTDKVEAKVISSFIGEEQAEVNYNRELKPYDFETLKQRAYTNWNGELSKLKVEGGTLEQQRTFYTALYRTMLFPRKTHEYDADNKQVHYSFFSGDVKAGSMYADNGFWDTFRAVHPFFTIMYPSLSEEIMQALVNISDQGGWLPEWFSPGYKDCMIGQNSVSVIADAYAKGIRGFDTDKMFAAMVKGANNEGPNATGRKGFEDYNKLGYIPHDKGVRESVSRTLEYAYNDFCIARFGEMTGQDEAIIKQHRERAMNYKHVFDESINFVRPKGADGSWHTAYTPDMWGGSFTEGSAWHWTWCVFHDPKGLMELMGGASEFRHMLDSVFTAAPTFDLTNHKHVIHEMKEMVACEMGQYAHGNQPIQHMVYLYNYAGEPYKAQYHAREIMDKLYSSGITDGKGLCGDEDNGQTSAWYVFSALGFYPVCPGEPEYVIGSPLFEKTSMTLENGNTFSVTAHNNSDANRYIQSAKLNGVVFDRTFIRHDEIMAGGELEFVMGPTPNKAWAIGEEARPFSMSQQ